MRLLYRYSWIPLSGLILIITFAYHEAASSPKLEMVPSSPKYQVSGDIPSLSATAFGIYDLVSGEVLLSHNAETALPIASVTKLATAAVLVSGYNLEERAAITESDLLGEGRAGNLEAGEEYTYHELLFPLLLESSNDAAEVYARVTDNALVSEMNHLAQMLNLTQTNFVDASGLSDSNISSVTDLQGLLRYIYQETPLVLDITRLRNYVGPYKAWTNNSPVKKQDYRGGKHGYTEAAGRTALAIFAEDFNAGERQLIYVVLGSENLALDIETLRNFSADSISYK